MDPIPEAPHCYSFRCEDDGDDDEDDNVEAHDGDDETATPNKDERILHYGPDTGSTTLLFFQMAGGNGREGQDAKERAPDASLDRSPRKH